MVCDRCIMTVEQTLGKLNIPFGKVTLGHAEVLRVINDDELQRLDEELKAVGFELIKDKNARLIEDIKTLVIEYIHYSDEKDIKINFSDYLSEKLNKSYSHITGLFSEMENITIEKYLILQKIERVKELISYGEYSFSEIAYKLRYSSIAHLSKQFKQVTGVTLSQYKNNKDKKRKTISSI